MSSRNARLSTSHGYSLVEVVIAVGVLATFCAGILSMVIFSMQVAHLNVMRNTAFTTAQGFLEQIESLRTFNIQDALADPENVPLPTVGLSALDTNALEINNPLYINDGNPSTTQDLNRKSILLESKEVGVDQNGNPIFEDVTMEMEFTVTVEPSTATTDAGDTLLIAYMITIDYRYETPNVMGSPVRSGRVQTIRTVASNQTPPP